MIKGIDISNWQGDVNFSKVAKEQDFVIIKASEGNGYKDPRFESYRNKLRELNIPRGYYHFARPDLNNTPENEADWFLAAVGELQENEVLALDFEVKVQDPVNWCKSFLDRISERLGGYKPLIYLDKHRVSSFDWSPVAKKGYGLWLAYWDYNPDGSFNVDHWDIVAMRQYTNQATVSGISGRVDANVFYGTLEQYFAYGIRKGATPCDKLKIENEGLKSENQSLKKEVSSLTGSLDSLNGLYKKLLDEDKIEDKEFQVLLGNYNDLTDSFKGQVEALFKKDKELLAIKGSNEKLTEENTRLRLQKFTITESIAFLIEAIKGGAKA